MLTEFPVVVRAMVTHVEGDCRGCFQVGDYILYDGLTLTPEGHRTLCVTTCQQTMYDARSLWNLRDTSVYAACADGHCGTGTVIFRLNHNPYIS